MREQFPESRARLEQLGFRSARSDSELRTDLPMRIAFDIVKHEHCSRPRRQLAHRLFDRLRDESAVAILFREYGVVLDVDLQLRNSPHLPQCVQRSVYRDTVGPRSKLRIAPVARERSEDLHPDLL